MIAFGTVTGVVLAYLAWITGNAHVILWVAGAVFGTLVALALAPITIPALAIAINVFYRKPPKPIRARHALREVTA